MRDVVVVPGRQYGPQAPLLAYASAAARARGARVREHEWTSSPDAAAVDDLGAFVAAEVRSVLDDTDGTPLLVGKSLGTFAAALAADRGLPAVWMTPLLRVPAVVAALRRASAPFLLVGGTADTAAWDGPLARSLTPHVHEAAGADHVLFVPGRLAASAAVLGEVATAVERFLDEVAWPAG